MMNLILHSKPESVASLRPPESLDELYNKARSHGKVSFFTMSDNKSHVTITFDTARGISLEANGKSETIHGAFEGAIQKAIEIRSQFK